MRRISRRNDIDDGQSYQALLRGQFKFLLHVFLFRDGKVAKQAVGYMPKADLLAALGL